MRDVDTLLRAESYSEAKKMLEIMAKDGDPEAYYMLGVLYDEGLGVPENVKQAIKFYEKAAIAGYIYVYLKWLIRSSYL